MRRKTPRRPIPPPAAAAGDAKPHAAKPAALAPSKVKPVANKIGEPRGNLVARAAAFLRRRGMTKS